MLQVAMMNFCYDIPVKLMSSHLLFAAVYVSLYDVRRLVSIFLLNRSTTPADLSPPLAPGRWIWAHRVVKAAVLVWGFLMPLVVNLRSDLTAPARQLTDVAGSYEVESFVRGGQEVPPVLTDATRWRYVAIEHSRFGLGGTRQPTDYLVIQRMDQSRIMATVQIQSQGKQGTLQQSMNSLVPSTISWVVTDDRHVTLTGKLAGDSLVVQLKRLKPDDFLLMNRGFRWINEYPYNR